MESSIYLKITMVLNYVIMILLCLQASCLVEIFLKGPSNRQPNRPLSLLKSTPCYQKTEGNSQNKKQHKQTCILALTQKIVTFDLIQFSIYINMGLQQQLIIVMGNECISSGPPRNLIQSAFVDFQQDNLPRSGNFNFSKQSTFNKIEAASRKFCINNQIDQNYVPIIARLLAYNHHHYFNAFKSIPLELRQKFVQHLANLEIQLMDSLYNHFIVMEKRHINPFQTIFNANLFIPPTSIKFNSIKYEHILSSEEIGRKLLTSKKVAVMLMIASNQEVSQHTSKALETIAIQGAATRLQLMLNRLKNNITSPKIFRNSLTRESLLDHEQNRQSLNRSLELISQVIIIACNQNNQKTIKNYMEKNQWFGFDSKLIKIMPIRNLPIINEEGKICLNFEFKTLVHPEGSAKCLELLLDHQTRLRGFLKYHKSQYLHVLDCQNLMQCPADPVFVGMASRFQRQLVAKCIPPQSLYQNRMRYVQSQSRLHLLSLKQLEYINDLDLLKNAPVALNSMVFQVNWLLGLIDNYDVEIALSRRYHPKEIKCNYYDFVKNIPVVGAKCYAFEKDLKDYICTTPKAQLIQYDRSYFSQLVQMMPNPSVKSFFKKQNSI